mmetsp:Transcript_9529/g.22575  ORF Transcript_9529/g.22575 Transcript_9529/m.22575 type:complete len:204 (-) Transcript_9529:4405-5016(-)
MQTVRLFVKTRPLVESTAFSIAEGTGRPSSRTSARMARSSTEFVCDEVKSRNFETATPSHWRPLWAPSPSSCSWRPQRADRPFEDLGHPARWSRWSRWNSPKEPRMTSRAVRQQMPPTCSLDHPRLQSLRRWQQVFLQAHQVCLRLKRSSTSPAALQQLPVRETSLRWLRPGRTRQSLRKAVGPCEAACLQEWCSPWHRSRHP